MLAALASEVSTTALHTALRALSAVARDIRRNASAQIEPSTDEA